MCGILGIVHVDNTQVNSDILKKMLGRQAHRGPDNTGYWLSEKIALGHNRLSIIDLSEKGHQPMFNHDKSMVIVFNGEIYNFEDIKSTLLQKGYNFKSNTDTEIVIHGYEEYGPSIVSKLNGMFSFAIYNLKDKSLFLARDRFGQKPLYYYFDKQKIVFASELKSILVHPNIDKSINHYAIDLFLSLQYIPAPYTIYQNINQLNASEYLLFQNGDVQIERYFDIKKQKNLADISYTEAKKLIKQKVTEAVSKRMMADVPLGSFLSGGIDSSIITALLAQHSGKPITTISVGFEEENYSELSKAKTIADKYQTNHYEYILSLEQAKKSVGDIITSYDQPFGDPSAIPTYFLSKVARENVTVALSGDGGDELFSGYQRYHLDPKFNTIQKHTPNIILKSFLNVFGMVPPLKNIPIEKNWVLGLKRLAQVATIDKKASILRWGSYFNYQQKTRLYKNLTYPEDEAVEYLRQIFESRSDFKDYTQKTQYTDIYSYAPGDYLVKTDIASMQHGLEVRCPLLDFELVNLAFSIPPKFHRKNNKGKYIFKDCFSDLLTEEVLHGPKMGFGIPIAEWFRGDWLSIFNDYYQSSSSFCRQYFNTQYIDELIEQHLKFKDDHSKRLYLLLVLEVWNDK